MTAKRRFASSACRRRSVLGDTVGVSADTQLEAGANNVRGIYVDHVADAALIPVIRLIPPNYRHRRQRVVAVA